MQPIRRTVWLCIFASALANAQSTPAKLALAEQLTTLLHFDSMFRDDLKECARPQNSPESAEASYRSHPESFEGLSPSSAYWHEVEALYTRFQARVCAYGTPESMARHFAEQLAQRASEEDMRASVAFYSSPAGKRLQTVTLEINKDFQSYATQLMLKAHTEAEAQFQLDIREVIAKFRKNPK